MVNTSPVVSTEKNRDVVEGVRRNSASPRRKGKPKKQRDRMPKLMGILFLLCPGGSLISLSTRIKKYTVGVRAVIRTAKERCLFGKVKKISEKTKIKSPVVRKTLFWIIFCQQALRINFYRRRY